MSEFMELKIDDVFSFSWNKDEFIGIVIEAKKDKIVFDDLVSIGNDLETQTTLYRDAIKNHSEFKFNTFMFHYTLSLDTPVDILKETYLEYFL